MKILVINAGSSSLKYQLFDMANKSLIAKGIVERIGIEGSNLTHKYGEGCALSFKQPAKVPNHSVAMELVLAALLDKEHGAIETLDEITAVGHRVLHGGSKFTASCVIDEACKDAIRECFPLGPLHNPANLMGIEACEKALPGVKQVAVFDTAFHQTMPPKAFLYGVPMKYYTEHHVRRYGFHGTSHRFVSGRAVEMLGREHSKIIVCHLGNGSSLSAVVDGKCVDTSMGLTPLEGVLMGTRSGNVDPAVVEFIANKEGWTVTETLNMLNKKSGLLGLAGNADMRDVMRLAAEGDENCKITLEVWAYGIRKYIGAYAAAMGGLDAIAFTAGIGENNPSSRATILEGLEFMGVKIDEEKNNTARGEADLSAADSKVKILLIPTNEELAIARDTVELI